MAGSEPWAVIESRQASSAVPTARTPRRSPWARSPTWCVFPMVVFGRWLETRWPKREPCATFFNPTHRRRVAHHPCRARNVMLSLVVPPRPVRRVLLACWQRAKSLVAWRGCLGDFFRASRACCDLFFASCPSRAGTGRLRLRLHASSSKLRLYGEILAPARICNLGPAEARADCPRRVQTMLFVVLPQPAQRAPIVSNTLEVVKPLRWAVVAVPTAVPGAPGAEPDLQSHADRARRRHLLRDALAAGAAAEPAREPRARGPRVALRI